MPTSPRRRIEAACATATSGRVVAGCVDLLQGRPVPEELVAVLGGRAADALLHGGLCTGGLPDQEHWLRVWGARGLLWSWDPAVEPALLAAQTNALHDALCDEAWRVREMACKVVARHLLGELLSDVDDLRQDPVPRVRAAAARAIERLVAAGA